MARRPVIGVVTHTIDCEQRGGTTCWGVGTLYIRALTQAGALPWVIPLVGEDLPTLRGIFDQLDGLYLTGGHDVHPQRYQRSRQDACRDHDLHRDEVEWNLLQWALADHKPILGICRGLQMINIALGGTLHQDLASCHQSSLNHDCFPDPQNQYKRNTIVHDIRVVTGSRLHHLIGMPDLWVNSMHHQGIERLGDRLTPCAFARDGLIEAIESTDDGFILGVQWHPEELVVTTPPLRGIYQGFVHEAAQHQRAAQYA